MEENRSITTSSKRQLSSSSSICELTEGSKKLCLEMPSPPNSPSESEMPAWAKLILEEVRSLKTAITERIDKVEMEVGDLRSTLEGVQDKMCKHDKAIVNNAQFHTQMRAQNEFLKGEVDSLNDRLNEQIHRNLRCHLTFIGIEQEAEEKTWDDTTNVLAKWLTGTDHTSMSATFIDENIIRCHRGPKLPEEKTSYIECGFSWKAADAIFSELGAQTTDGVNVRQKFSKGTQKRRNLALIERKSIKSSVGSEWKIFLKYPATLLAKKPGESAYKIIEKF